MKWFEGSINEAVAASKAKKAIFVVFVGGNDDASLQVSQAIESSEISSRLEQDNFVAVRIESGSETYRFFAQIYQLVPVPSVFFIGETGVPLEIVAGSTTASELGTKIDEVLAKSGKSASGSSLSFIQSEKKSAESTSATVTTEIPSVSNTQGESKKDEKKAAELSHEEKVKRAQELMELQKKQRVEEEMRKEKEREIERRRREKEVQELRLKQRDMEIKQSQEERLREKAADAAARERVRQQIAQDKLMRKEREQALQVYRSHRDTLRPKPCVKTQKVNFWKAMEVGSSSDEEMEVMVFTPPELAEMVKLANVDLIPKQSATKYDAAYNAFLKFKETHKTTSTSENVLLAYFKTLSDKYKPSSLQSLYSMLKTVIKAKENQLDIGQYKRVQAFLRNKNSGYEAKKSDVFTSEDVRKFLENAPDAQFLATKTVLIMGLMGVCRSQELWNMKITDIQERDGLVVVNIPDTKTKKLRHFVINEGQILDLVKNYRAVRPKKCLDPSFFLTYRNEKCTTQCMGKHTIAKQPSIIAKWLGKENTANFTGHCFRRTAATIFSDAGGDFVALKELGGWKSDTVAQGYIQQSINKKSENCAVLTNALGFAGPSSTIVKSNETVNTFQGVKINASEGNVKIINQNCVVHIHNYKVINVN